MKLDVQAVELDMLANTFMRAPGEAVGSFALECAIDELAERIGIDPVELRIRNEPDKDPTSGKAFSSRHLVEAYRTGAERFGWADRDPRPGARREGEWLIGMGCATATYPYHRFPGGVARITLTRDGHVKVEIAAHEMGMGTATAQTQVTAERLGLPLESVTVAYGDSSLPRRRPGRRLASDRLDRRRGDRRATRARGRAAQARRQRLAARRSRAGRGRRRRRRPLQARRARAARELRLDPRPRAARRGERRGRRAAAGRDGRSGRCTPTARSSARCASTRSPARRESAGSSARSTADASSTPRWQPASSAAGSSWASDSRSWRRRSSTSATGRIMNPSLAEYHVPVHLDVPEIDVIWTDIPDPHAPMGAHGIGEIGITGVGAAVANAIYNATGTRVRELPITLDKLLAAWA